jgi:biotin carboxyl carrier protein
MSNIKYEDLEIDGVVYKTTFSNKYINRKPWNVPDAGSVKTYIPGTIVDVHVKEQQQIKVGDLLCTLEAMKMRNKVLAPVAGIVAKIHVKKGDKLPKNTLMFQIEQ